MIKRMSAGMRYFESASCLISLGKLDSPINHMIRDVSQVKSQDRRKGHATGLMQEVCAEADRCKATLLLQPGPESDEPMDRYQLMQFYAGFGFQQLSPDLDPQIMYRKPSA